MAHTIGNLVAIWQIMRRNYTGIAPSVKEFDHLKTEELGCSRLTVKRPGGAGIFGAGEVPVADGY